MKKKILPLMLAVLFCFCGIKAAAMQIFIKVEVDCSDRGKHIILEAEPTDRIEDIKQMIFDKTGLEPASQVLYFGDKLLEDGNTLQDYSVQKDSTLKLTEGQMRLWLYDMTARTLSRGGVVLNNVTADGINLTIGANSGLSGRLDLSGKISGGYMITAIGDGAFKNCASLTGLTLPDSLTYIGGNAFESCSGPEQVSLPDGLSAIGEEAFKDCAALKNIILPDSLSQIGRGAFAWCEKLESITLPRAVEKLEKETFYGCSSLKTANLPQNLSRIGESAFGLCFSLEKAEIPAGTKSVGKAAFYKCSSLKTVSLPRGLEEIGDSAFLGCTSLTAIGLPDSLRVIADQTFADCTSLKSISLPENLAEIGIGAFRSCHSLAAIDLPQTVTSLGNGAFEGCSSLKTISLPRGLMFLPDWAFYRCSGLQTINLPSGLMAAGSYALGDCVSLKTVTLPDTFAIMADDTFAGCRRLTDVTCLAQQPPQVIECSSTDIFAASDIKKISVPADSLEDYRQAEGWKVYFDRLEAIPDPQPTPSPDPSYDWNGVLAAINALGGKGSLRVDVGRELVVPHFIWQAIYGKNITVTFVRGQDSFVVNGTSLGANFDPNTGHMLSEFSATRTNPNTGVRL